MISLFANIWKRQAFFMRNGIDGKYLILKPYRGEIEPVCGCHAE